MSKLRVCVVVASFYPAVGGIQTQALIQSQGLRERGYEVSIVTLHHDRAWLQRETLEGVSVTRVAGLFLPQRERLPRLLQRLWYLLALFLLGCHLWSRRASYDLLHVHQLNLLALAVAPVALLSGKPMVVVMHCADSDRGTSSDRKTLSRGSFESVATRLYVKGQERDGGDLEGLERAGKLFVHLLHALLVRTRAEVVTLSSRMRADLAAHGFVLRRVRCIPNGVDTRRFVPLARDVLIQRPQVVVSTSRLCYQKGIDVLLQAWKLVMEQAPASARLLLVGDGPMQSQLKQMAATLGLGERVIFAGERRDIAVQLQQGTIGVLPSRWEGMPVALLEAMACGLPCVATRVSGSEDILQSGVNGLLVEPEDHVGLAQALLTLLGEPCLARQYGEAARATVEAHYSLEHVLDSLIALYDELTHRSDQETISNPSRRQRKDLPSCAE